jgi:hypothetical protein
MSYVSDVAYTILFPDVAQYRMYIAEVHALSNQPMHADDIVDIRMNYSNRRKKWGDMVSGLAETRHGEALIRDRSMGKEMYYPCISYYQKGVRWFNGVYGTAPPDHEDLLYLAQQRSKVYYKDEVNADWDYTKSTHNLTLCAYKFIRLGENSEDTEVRTGGSHYISVHNLMVTERRISVNDEVKRVLSDISCVV